jgi:hypothetical protein
MKILLSVNKFQFDKKKRNQSFLILEKPVNIKKDNKYLIGMELRETERNYVTMLSNIIRVRPIFTYGGVRRGRARPLQRLTSPSRE